MKFLSNAWRKWNRPKGKAYEEMMASIRPVERPARYPSDILGQAGWHQMDFSCPITEQTWTSVKASADSALSAAELVAEGEKVAYALKLLQSEGELTIASTGKDPSTGVRSIDPDRGIPWRLWLSPARKSS